VIEPDTTERACPPHYWVITAGLAQSHVQVWTCRRCATRKDVAPLPTSWRGGMQGPAKGGLSTVRLGAVPSPCLGCGSRFLTVERLQTHRKQFLNCVYIRTGRLAQIDETERGELSRPVLP
jgi:hypothetical protein